jgi:hypothetical protein
MQAQEGGAQRRILLVQEGYRVQHLPKLLAKGVQAFAYSTCIFFGFHLAPPLPKSQWMIFFVIAWL